MKIQFYGHSCFGIQVGDKHLLIDPFITGNPLASNVDVDTIPADYILITHGHVDHVLDAEIIAKRTGAMIISNFEIVSWYEGKGITNVHPLNHGGQKSFEFGSVKYVNAIHSSVLPDGTYGGNPGGFVIRGKEKTIYLAGDTALTLDMKLLGDYESIDLAILPIGDNFTMGVADAIICADFIDCKRIIGMHFDTFPPIEINHREAIDAFVESGKELILMEIGGTLDI
ncbi:MAG: L-ascorbate metabolism protein UlaG (beta-lactamase superfamily) [Flavobacteriales bacterium]|jgi:L-ascorbate metabolism protein UlaG (beta-lactamase superfamily)